MDCRRVEAFDYAELKRRIRESRRESPLGVHYFGTRWENRREFDQSLLKYIEAIRSAYRDENGGGDYKANDEGAEDRQTTLAPSTGLLLVTFQRPLQPVVDLLRRKRVCSTGQGAAIWSKDLENKLVAAIRDANLARLFVACI